MLKQFILWAIGQLDYRYYTPLVIDFLKASLWPLVVIIMGVVFRGKISELLEFEGFGAKAKWKSKGEDAAPQLTMFRSRQQPSDNQSLAELALLLSNYQFVWGAWAMSPEYCHAVRFSEKYSGGELRFIDQFVNDTVSFLNEKGAALPQDVKAQFDELLSFLKGVLPYHESKEQLSRPVFSIPQYQTLLRSLIQVMQKHLKA